LIGRPDAFGGGQTIKRVVRIIVRAGAIDHLGDIVDGIELILEISKRVGALRVGEARETVDVVVLISAEDAIRQGS